jgi:hypothetical protein
MSTVTTITPLNLPPGACYDILSKVAPEIEGWRFVRADPDTRTVTWEDIWSYGLFDRDWIDLITASIERTSSGLGQLRFTAVKSWVFYDLMYKKMRERLCNKMKERMALHCPLVLFLSASPDEMQAIRSGREFNAAYDGLFPFEGRKRVDARYYDDVRPIDVQRLLEAKPAFVHFCGHFSKSGNLLLRGDGSEGREVDVNGMVQYLSALDGYVQCVVLSACSSSEYAKALAEKVDCVVIGMPFDIKNSTAIDFSAAFYAALGAGKSIQNAFALGCTHTESGGLRSGVGPRLFATRSDPSALHLVSL